jgi:hypothetical protein
LRYLDGEAGSERVAAIVAERGVGLNRILIPAVNSGEVAGVLYKTHGLLGMQGALEFLASIGFETIAATGVRAAHSAVIKARRKIPYADAFGIELAGDSPDHVLVTADFDAKPAENDVRIEFLPAKPKPH